MTETDTQPVVDATHTTAKPVVEGSDARNDGNDLDSLLAAFDTQTKTTVSPAPNQPVAPDVTALAATVQSLQGQIAEVSNFKFRQDMDETIKDIRGDMDGEVFDNEFVESWLDAQARKDQRLQTAWLQRESNPGQFKKIRAELGKAFVKKFSKLPDKQVTEDREAVTAAVRGASTRAPADAPVKYGNQSNAEFRNTVKDQYGFDPGV